jgi:cyclophilin family peptidyl-prolyl cis-trans isomerase
MNALVLLLTMCLQQAAASKVVPFTTPLTPAEMKDRQAVIDTTAGTIVLDLLADAAPNHVGYFIKLASEGAYNGTTFHRLIKYGIIQGGDPLSKDPAKRDVYGTGGLGVLEAEVSAEKHTRGAVSSVLLPGKPDSGGSQFFTCIVDQPVLDGQYTVFARVVEGMKVVRTLQPEFNDLPHVKGTLSMARGDDAASASTSFFICTAPAPSLDRVYTAFGRVVDGLAVVEAIEATPVDGERPKERIEIIRARVTGPVR